VIYFRKKTLEEAIISQWWGAEAQVELSFSMELKNIGLICNFVYFQDPKIPCQLLASRKNSPLKNILVSLDDTRKVKNERKQGETYQSNIEICSLYSNLFRELVNIYLNTFNRRWMLSSWPNASPSRHRSSQNAKAWTDSLRGGNSHHQQLKRCLTTRPWLGIL